jgi:hypothetical protein
VPALPYFAGQHSNWSPVDGLFNDTASNVMVSSLLVLGKVIGGALYKFILLLSLGRYEEL